jgi:hypothetical protein
MFMEMSFPLLANQFGVSSMRPDFRALLSKAISRQAASVTARSMVHAMRSPQINDKPAGAMGSRILYFAGNRKAVAGVKKTTFGSFFPEHGAGPPFVGNNKQAIYQDGLGNSKHIVITSDLSELLANNPGQETLRNL